MVSTFKRVSTWLHIIGARSAPKLTAFIVARATVFKYIVAGGTAAVVDLGLLFLFTDVFKLHYLISAIIAFVFAFFVSFILQKYWTFEDNSTERVHAQAFVYLVVSIANLGLNTLYMYILVDTFGLWYLSSQVAGALVACGSFFVYRLFIFKKKGSASPSAKSPDALA